MRANVRAATTEDLRHFLPTELGDVERVCERVIILHQGNILLQGLVRELCLRRQDRYRLQLQGKIADYLAELRLEMPSFPVIPELRLPIA